LHQVERRKVDPDPTANRSDRQAAKAGMNITRPDLTPFRAKMGPFYERTADYAEKDNAGKFREIVDK
jgi:hypothetical protein